MHTCNFCGEDQTKVNRIIVDKDKAICDACIFLCMEILLEETKREYKEIAFERGRE